MKLKLDLPEGVSGSLWRHAYKESQCFSLHRHDELEANLVLSGQATYLLNGRRQHLRARDLLWLFPEHDHVLLHQSPDFVMWILVWKPRALRLTCTLPQNEVLLNAQAPHDVHRRLSGARTEELVSLFERLRGADSDLQRAGLAWALLLAWTAFNEADPLADGEELHPSVEHSARLLRDGDESGLEELARKVGLSPFHLSRLFKKQTGQTISEFRNRCRVGRFMQLYHQSRQAGMRQAAFAAGFGSYSRFHRVFMEVTGQAPSHYARKLK